MTRNAQPASTKADPQKPAADAPTSEWIKWHASAAPPRSRDFYDSMSRILGVNL